MADLVLIPSVHDMDDETLIKHMMARHDEMIADGYDPSVPEPERERKGLPLRLRAGVEWRGFHDKMHEIYDGRVDGAKDMFNHFHKEPSDG